MMDIQTILPPKTFVSASHFHGVVLGYENGTVLFYQDNMTEEKSGLMELTTDLLKDDILTSEYVEINTRFVGR